MGLGCFGLADRGLSRQRSLLLSTEPQQCCSSLWEPYINASISYPEAFGNIQNYQHQNVLPIPHTMMYPLPYLQMKQLCLRLFCAKLCVESFKCKDLHSYLTLIISSLGPMVYSVPLILADSLQPSSPQPRPVSANSPSLVVGFPGRILLLFIFLLMHVPCVACVCLSVFVYMVCVCVCVCVCMYF